MRCLYEPINGDYPTAKFCNEHITCESCPYHYDEELMPNCKDCQSPDCQRIGCDIPGGCPSYTPDLFEAANCENKGHVYDVNESDDHFCKSLNDLCIYCFTVASALEHNNQYDLFREHLETIGHYLMNAQEVIWHLRNEVKKLKEENKMTNYGEVRKFLKDVPTDIAGCIKEEFFGWPKGTKVSDIEKWFDKKARGESTRHR